MQLEFGHIQHFCSLCNNWEFCSDGSKISWKKYCARTIFVITARKIKYFNIASNLRLDLIYFSFVFYSALY